MPDESAYTLHVLCAYQKHKRTADPGLDPSVVRAESSARLNFGERDANLRIKVVERGHFLEAGFVARS